MKGLNVRRIQKVCQRRFNSDFWMFFLADEGREDPNTTKSISSLARQRNTIEGVMLTGR